MIVFRKNHYLLAILISVASCTATRVQNQPNLSVERNQKKTVRALDLSNSVTSCRHTEKAFNCVKVVGVYDGDTIFIDIPGYHPIFGRRIGVRILGIDAAELRSSDSCEKNKAQEAKSLLESILRDAKRVDITDLERDKYFRILGTVLVDGRSIADELLERRLAYAYYGTKKPKTNWCQ